MFLPVDQSNEVQWHDNRIWQTSFRHRIVDLIQWSVVVSTFTLKSLFKTCGKYLIPNMQCERLYQ